MPAGLIRTVGCLIAIAAPAGAAAADWTTRPDTSTVTLYATKQGAWFDGVFATFTATIDFDPATPAAGSIIGVVRTDSFDTEDDQNDTYVRGYLDVEHFPEARFESTSIEKTAEGYRATGELELTGHRNPATLDFTFAMGGESSLPPTHAKFTGSMTVNRFDYDIAADVDTSWAGQDVTIWIELDLEDSGPD